MQLLRSDCNPSGLVTVVLGTPNPIIGSVFTRNFERDQGFDDPNERIINKHDQGRCISQTNKLSWLCSRNFAGCISANADKMFAEKFETTRNPNDFFSGVMQPNMSKMNRSRFEFSRSPSLLLSPKK